MYSFKDLYEYYDLRDFELSTRFMLNTINGHNMDLWNKKISHSLTNVLSNAFIWSATPEGSDFWVQEFKKLETI